MMNYAQHVSPRATPASEQADPRQVPNSGGGFAFQIDRWKRLERFLILGTEGGTYYASERKITLENAGVLQACLQEDGLRTVEVIWGISMSGRAPKNDAAVFALAMAAAAPDEATRRAALAALPKVCRIGTHLFQFIDAVQQFRGWGPALTKAVSRWYQDKDVKDVMYQVVKYGQRQGVSQRDVLRLAHPRTDNVALNALFRYLVTGSGAEQTVKRKGRDVTEHRAAVALPEFITAFDEMKTASPERAVALIRQHGFTHEMVTGELKKHRIVWEALAEKMPMTALIRNLAKLTSLGIIAPMSAGAADVANKITDAAALKKARVHPISILTALAIYRQGHGDKGSLTWTPVPRVIDALDSAFYQAFESVEPTGKNTMIALDISGSMGGPTLASGLTPREISAAMAMVTVRTEPNHMVVGFSYNVIPLPISPKQRLDDVVEKISALNFGSTDCSAAFQYATRTGVPVDMFQVWTDNETNNGSMPPHQALRQYRERSGRPAKLAVAAVTATEFTIADPNDAGMIDCVGFDSNVPSILASFAKGE